jgi:formate dehydrogenase beta subunit
MKLTRRKFFTVNAVGAAALAGSAAPAEAAGPSIDYNAPAVLVDTTRCVGCRACEAACSESNGLPGPEMAGDDRVFDSRRDMGPDAFTVVNRYRPIAGGGDDRFVKTQCMHCLEPACASACPARALEKNAHGQVVYNGDRCLGCRYCMMACPFEVPRFEYAKAVPYVKKCTFCADRQAQGLPPACAEVCPSGALTFGRRAELLEEAKTRIYQNPGTYARHVYGEHEAGGTSWLYISDVPLDQIGLRAGLMNRPYPDLTKTALAAVPVVMTLWPPLLMGLYTFSRRRDRVTAEHGESEHKEDRHA